MIQQAVRHSFTGKGEDWAFRKGRQGTIHLSIIIPAYNEEKRVGEYLRELGLFLLEKPYGSEIIVVDDGSDDSTSAVIRLIMTEFPAVSLIRLDRNRGKGAAVTLGLAAGRGDYLLFSDADGSAPVGEIDKLVGGLDAGADIVAGSRAFPDRSKIVARRHRVAIGAVLRAIQRLMGVDVVRDTQCGFKAMTAGVARSVLPQMRESGYGFDIEFLVLARQKGYRIAETPIDWTHRDGAKVHLLRDSLKILRTMIRLQRD